MKRKIIYPILLLLVGSMMWTGCKKEEYTIDESLLIGKWCADGTQEYWRFDANYEGETWDESEDVQEGEGTHYTWSVSVDRLSILLQGTMGQVVPYDYTFTSQTDRTFTWRDGYGNTRSFSKVSL